MPVQSAEFQHECRQSEQRTDTGREADYLDERVSRRLSALPKTPGGMARKPGDRAREKARTGLSAP